MKYLLDTNVLIAIFRDEHGIREAILQAGTKNCAISELTFGELLVGAYKGKNKRQRKEVEIAGQMFQMIPVTSDIIDCWAKQRANLELQGKKIDSIDLLIASTALQNNLTIVTHNIKHFDRVPNLNIVDWETK